MTKIVQALKTLNQKEIKYFKLFLQSPIHKGNKNKIKKYEFIFLAIQENIFYEKEISEEAIFFKMNPSKSKFNARTFRELCSELLELFNQFLVYLELQADERQRKRYLLKATRRRGLLTIFEKELGKTREEQKKEIYPEFDYLFHQFLVEDAACRYNTIYKNRNVNIDFKTPIQYLDYYYILHKLRYSLTVTSRGHGRQEKQDIWLMKEMLIYLKNNNFEDYPLLPCYYNLLLINQNMEDEKPFFKLKKLLEKHREIISLYELRQIVMFAINYCRLRSLAGHYKFKIEEYILYEILIEKQAIYVGLDSPSDYIAPNLFRNIVDNRLYLAKSENTDFFQRADDFITDYKDKIMPQHRDITVHFCQAAYHFAKKEFEVAERHLGEIWQEEWIDVYYNIYYRTLEVQIAYEMKRWIPLTNKLENFRRFLKDNNQISPNFHEAYLNFTKFIWKIFRRGNKQNTPESIAQLKREIKDKKTLREALWLQEKADEL